MQSPLHPTHEQLGATFTPFGVWTMPLKYGNELDEHRAVRTDAGIFDLSHMGEIRVTGPDASALLDYALISTLSTAAIGQAKYSMLVNPDGGIIDDLLTYRLADTEFLVVPNAGNTDAVWQALNERSDGYNATLTNETADTALIAVQGPRSTDILTALGADVTDLGYYRCQPTTSVAGQQVMLARTGYTGEDGFEIYLPSDAATAMWDAVMEHTPTPCGLAARDSLRLEAAMPLYGNELSTDITPVDAGMSRAFTAKKVDFVGREAVVDKKPRVEIIGLISEQRRAARAGADIYRAGEKIGTVTSGQPSPTLGHPIALAHITPGAVSVGDNVDIDIRGKRYPFIISTTPFYTKD